MPSVRADAPSTAERRFPYEWAGPGGETVRPGPLVPPGMDLLKADYVDKLGPLLSAEAAAEAPGTGVDAADLEQAVWVRLLESGRHAPDPAEPAEPARWLRRAVRAEARLARRRARREVPYGHRQHSVDGSTPAARPPRPNRKTPSCTARRTVHSDRRSPGCPDAVPS